MEQVRVRIQHATLARVTISNIVALPIEMAEKRRKKKKQKPQQLELPMAA